MRDWPLLLVATAFCFGAAARYIVEDGMDSLAFGASLFAAAAFGAWLYSLGQQAAESIRDNYVRHESEV